MIKKLFLVFAIWWIVINTFAFFSMQRLHLSPDLDPVKQRRVSEYTYFKPLEKFENFVGIHARRQSLAHYIIAQQGYSQYVSVFFPLYPFLIKSGNMVGLDYILTGFIISNIALFLSVVVFYKLAALEFKKEISERSVFYLLIFPTAFFLTMVYTESLFLLLSLLTFYFALKRRWLLVGIFGLLATLTRVTGIYLFLPILWEYWHQEKRIKPDIIFLLLIPFAVISFFTYHAQKFGNFFIFLEGQKAWNREFLNFSHLFGPYPSVAEKMNFSLEVFAIVILVAACILAFKRIRFSYWLYLILSAVIPPLSGSFESTIRYMLVLFPMFIVFSQLGENPYFDRLYTFVAILLLSFSTLLIVNYFWVG